MIALQSNNVNRLDSFIQMLCYPTEPHLEITTSFNNNHHLNLQSKGSKKGKWTKWKLVFVLNKEVVVWQQTHTHLLLYSTTNNNNNDEQFIIQYTIIL